MRPRPTAVEQNNVRRGSMRVSYDGDAAAPVSGFACCSSPGMSATSGRVGPPARRRELPVSGARPAGGAGSGPARASCRDGHDDHRDDERAGEHADADEDLLHEGQLRQLDERAGDLAADDAEVILALPALPDVRVVAERAGADGDGERHADVHELLDGVLGVGLLEEDRGERHERARGDEGRGRGRAGDREDEDLGGEEQRDDEPEQTLEAELRELRRAVDQLHVATSLWGHPSLAL
jgi:hypothetical protein